MTDRSEIGRRDPTLDPSKTATWRFARAVLTEVANVFDDQYIHLGGDGAFFLLRRNKDQSNINWSASAVLDNLQTRSLRMSLFEPKANGDVQGTQCAHLTRIFTPMLTMCW